MTDPKPLPPGGRRVKANSPVSEHIQARRYVGGAEGELIKREWEAQQDAKLKQTHKDVLMPDTKG